MTKNEIAQITQNLLQQKSELQEQEEQLKGENAPVALDQAKVGRLSRMDAMQLQQMAQEETRRRQQRLVKIEGALRRIETDEYGYCFVCDEEIDLRRLFFDPTNTRCIKCAD